SIAATSDCRALVLSLELLDQAASDSFQFALRHSDEQGKSNAETLRHIRVRIIRWRDGVLLGVVVKVGRRMRSLPSNDASLLERTHHRVPHVEQTLAGRKVGRLGLEQAHVGLVAMHVIGISERELKPRYTR